MKKQNLRTQRKPNKKFKTFKYAKSRFFYKLLRFGISVCTERTIKYSLSEYFNRLYGFWCKTTKMQFKLECEIDIMGSYTFRHINVIIKKKELLKYTSCTELEYLKRRG